MMPTAARLIAALVLAVTAWIVSQTVKTHLPDGINFGWFDYVNVAIGAVSGWIVIGRRAGLGILPAIGHGLTGVAVLVFWAIFLQSTNEMLRLSLRRHYKGPVEALLDIFQIGAEYTKVLPYLDVAGALVLGGLIAGILSELANRVWR